MEDLPDPQKNKGKSSITEPLKEAILEGGEKKILVGTHQNEEKKKQLHVTGWKHIQEFLPISKGNADLPRREINNQ